MPSKTSDQPGHDKTNKRTLCQVKRQISQGMTKPTIGLYDKQNVRSAWLRTNKRTLCQTIRQVRLYFTKQTKGLYAKRNVRSGWTKQDIQKGFMPSKTSDQPGHNKTNNRTLYQAKRQIRLDMINQQYYFKPSESDQPGHNRTNNRTTCQVKRQISLGMAKLTIGLYAEQNVRTAWAWQTNNRALRQVKRQISLGITKPTIGLYAKRNVRSACA